MELRCEFNYEHEELLLPIKTNFQKSDLSLNAKASFWAVFYIPIA